MRYVDHDPTAARVAALRCRDAAYEYDRIAGVIVAETAGVDWWGRERDRTLDDVEVLATDLRREADALRDTADRLEEAASQAVRAEDARAAEAAAAATAAAAAAAASNLCQPTWGPSVSTSTTQSSSSKPSSSSTTVPKGVL